jgi:preprotein translocase subunit SecE
MAMNREQKRASKRSGMTDADGQPVSSRERRQQPSRSLKEERTKPREYVREVIAEMKKCSWPTRKETMRLAAIVFVAIIVLTAFIFGVDAGFGTLLEKIFTTTASKAILIPALPLALKRVNR